MIDAELARRAAPQHGFLSWLQYGIPVTTPARTLLDLADVLPDAQLTRAVNQARLECHLRLEHLAAVLIRSPGRRATRRLRPFIEHADAPTRSPDLLTAGYPVVRVTWARLVNRPDGEAKRLMALLTR